MHYLRWCPALAMMTLYIILGFSSMAGANTNSSADTVEKLKSAQETAIKKADTTRDEAGRVENSATSSPSADKKAEQITREAIAQALALAEQGYRHAATLYDKAAQNYEEGKSDTGSTNALLAESAEECADQVRQAALDAQKLYENEAYQAATEKAQAASQQGKLCNAYAEAGGEEEAGAGLGEQPVSTITPPIKTIVDNPLDSDRNPSTASGF